MRVAHASTYPSATAASGSVPRLRESTSPAVTLTRHLPQVPSPPQGESISTPACRAASSNRVCGGTWTDLPEGWNSTLGMGRSGQHPENRYPEKGLQPATLFLANFPGKRPISRLGGGLMVA